MTHIVIYGVGAIGGFYGIKLANYLRLSGHADYRLSFIARGETYTNLYNSGAKLVCKKATLGEMQETIIIEKNLNLYEKYSELKINADEDTIVLLCVKSKDTISACNDIKTKLTDRTHVVSIQNGVENEERMVAVLGLKHVVGALTNIAAEVLEPGLYLQKGNYGLLIGELDGSQSERLELIERTLKAVGIHIKITNQIYIDMWSKLVWNASFNPMSVLHEMTVGQLLAVPEYRKTILSIMTEAKILAQAQGYQVKDDVDTEHLVRTDVPEWHDFRPSSLQDYQNGKAIEIEDLLGVIIRRGEEFKVPTPEAERIYKELKEKLISK